MEMQCWNYLDTVEVIGSIPVAPTRKFNRLGESTWPAFSLCAQTGAQIAIEENGSKTLFADSKDSVFVASTTIHNPRTSFPDQAAFSTSKCLELLRLTPDTSTIGAGNRRHRAAQGVAIHHSHSRR